jgi:long-chain fatty acid transport protein
MGISFGKTAVSAGVVLSVLSAGIGDASAGGFAIREQSTYGQGASFAGIAAGGALSGMFWNPAVMTQFSGIQLEAGFAGIFPNAEHIPGAGSTLFALGGVSDSGKDALVPSTYASWQVAANVWLGLSVNAPYGLRVNFPDAWAGRNYAGNSGLRTYNATPTVAVRVNEWLSLGAGVQIMWATTALWTGLGPFPGTALQIEGDGWAFGATLGATITPGPNTQIGIGWRSAMDLDIDGTADLIPAGLRSNASTTVKLPDTVTLGIRQRVTPALTLLGTVEWSHWSRIGTSTVATALPIGAVPLPFEYDDGWFFSIGAEYLYSPNLMLRAGLGYEISPITDDVRTPRLPDNDRIWTSIGLSYRAMENLWLDLAYTHIFIKDTPINIGPGHPHFNPLVPILYNGTVDSSVDIISLGLRYQLGAPPPLVVKG